MKTTPYTVSATINDIVNGGQFRDSLDISRYSVEFETPRDPNEMSTKALLALARYAFQSLITIKKLTARPMWSGETRGAWKLAGHDAALVLDWSNG